MTISDIEAPRQTNRSNAAPVGPAVETLTTLHATSDPAGTTPAPAPAARTGRPQHRRTKRRLVLADAAAVIVGLVVSRLLVPRGLAPQGGFGSGGIAATLTAYASVPLWLVAFAQQGLYHSRLITRQLDELRRLTGAVVAGTVAVLVLAVAVELDPSRLWLLAVFSAVLFTTTVERQIARSLFNRARREGRMMRAVVVIGCNAEGVELARMLSDDPSLGYRVVGFVDDGQLRSDNQHSVLGTIDQTVDVVRAAGAGGVIVAATALDLGASNRLIRSLTEAGIHVELSSTLQDIAAHRLTVRPLGRFPVVYVEPVRRNGWRAHAKRTFDVVVASAAILLSAPICLVTAIAVRLESSGPIIFRQVRVGVDGKPFELMKFRTMCEDAEDRIAELMEQNEVDGPLFKMAVDPRVTRVGRLLRSASIDEIPQLWNVLRGEMSLVGPRPALPREVQLWGSRLHGRLRVKPGITGMWQVNGRSSASFEDYERLDLYYVDNWSLITDLAIIVKTVPVVVLRKGAH